MATESGFQITGTTPERYHQFVAPIMAPFVDALLEWAQVRPGDAALDLACGTGFIARLAAARTGPTGRVVGVDVSGGMLAVASDRSRAVTPTIDWHEASADALPFSDACFDAVLCQQGLQFFPNKAAALAEAARVARPGGRVGATVWIPPFGGSPYFEAQFAAVAELIGEEEAQPLMDSFSLPEDELVAIFRSAGLDAVVVREVVAAITLPPLDEFVPGHITATPWGLAAVSARPDGLEVASRLMLSQLAPQTNHDGSATLPFASHLVGGHR